MSDRPKISVAVVAWNTWVYLEPCLEAFYAAEPEGGVEVIVVDNGSTDGGIEALRAEWPQVKLIVNDENVGFARGTNQGVEAATGEYVLLLNPDTLPAPGAVDRLREYLDARPAAAAAGGRLINADGSFQGAYSDFPTLTQELLIATGLGERIWPGYPSHRQSDEARPVDWITGAFLLIRRDMYLAAGGLDEEYVMYSEEVDLQYRFKRLGWTVHYLPEVTTLHYGGGSQGRVRRRRMVYRGKLMFFAKNYGPVRRAGLRMILGGTAAAKLAVWAAGWCLGSIRRRAAAEMRSNLEVLRLCWAVSK